MSDTILLIGSITAGKTTLCQRLNDASIKYTKTQAIEALGNTVDTPGEYFDHGRFWSALQVSANSVGTVLLLVDPTAPETRMPPGIAGTFAPPVWGVVTKADNATEEQIENAKQTLAQGGASPIFVTDAVAGRGIDELREALWPS